MGVNSFTTILSWTAMEMVQVVGMVDTETTTATGMALDPDAATIA
jgi:hypothetical protein